MAILCLEMNTSWFGLEPLGEVVEGDAHLGADVGDEVRVEHERFARASERLERADLDRCERRRCVAGVVAHRQDCIHRGHGDPPMPATGLGSLGSS